MSEYLRISILYLAISALVACVLRGGDPTVIVKLASNSVVVAGLLGDWAGPAILAGCILIALGRSGRALSERLARGALALVVTVIFMSAFTIAKTSFPLILDFWADPMLARLDVLLHGGVTPWIWGYEHLGWLAGPWLMEQVYIRAWAPLAMFYPVALALADPDADRVRRHLRLYALSFVVLGNVIALGFFSGGPIFYDLIEESGQFAGLLRTLNETGLAGSTIGRIQENLWEFHISGNEALGSGISAFPSVHVAVATLPVVYLLERRNWFAVPAIGFLAMIQMMSVLTGYHYAVDGYASMAGVAFLWWAFCRTRPAASDERITPQPAASGAAQSS